MAKLLQNYSSAIFIWIIHWMHHQSTVHLQQQQLCWQVLDVTGMLLVTMSAVGATSHDCSSVTQVRSTAPMCCRSVFRDRDATSNGVFSSCTNTRTHPALSCPPGGIKWYCDLRSVCPSLGYSTLAAWRSCLGYRHAGCLQLAGHQRCADCGPVRGRM